MRGRDFNQTMMLSYVTPEQRIPQDHPIRRILKIANQAIQGLGKVFGEMYSPLGRRSIPPEQMMRALLLQLLFSIRSERKLMEELDYNLMYRWFVGLSMDDPIWDASTFSKNRERFLGKQVAQEFFAKVLEQAEQHDLLSEDHFTVDGTLLEAWASVKSYQKKDEPPQKGTGSRGEILLRDTHQSRTDTDACLYKKSRGGESKLSYLGHVLMENRHGLVAQACATQANSKAEGQAALQLLGQAKRGRRPTLGADKAYDEAGLVEDLRKRNVTPHIHQHISEKRGSNIDGRTTRHAGYAISLKKRKCVEHIFGWIKNTAKLGKLRHRGVKLVDWMFTFAASAYNVVRLAKLIHAG